MTKLAPNPHGHSHARGIRLLKIFPFGTMGRCCKKIRTPNARFTSFFFYYMSKDKNTDEGDEHILHSNPSLKDREYG